MTSTRGTIGERGSVSLLAIACLTMLLLLGSALGVVAAMVRAHRVAQSAADLTALAVASAVVRGRDPCAVGEGIAEANGASLTSCQVVGRDAIVTVEVTGPQWLGQVDDLGAEARAGPG